MISGIFGVCQGSSPFGPNFLIFTTGKRSLGQGNVFTPVCHSVHMGLCIPACNGADTPPLDTTGYGQQVGSTHPTGMHTCYTLSVEMWSNYRLASLFGVDVPHLGNPRSATGDNQEFQSLFYLKHAITHNITGSSLGSQFCTRVSIHQI